MDLEHSYVTQGEWLTPPGRPDLIDLVADEHERRPPGSVPNGRRHESPAHGELPG